MAGGQIPNKLYYTMLLWLFGASIEWGGIEAKFAEKKGFLKESGQEGGKRDERWGKKGKEGRIFFEILKKIQNLCESIDFFSLLSSPNLLN